MTILNKGDLLIASATLLDLNFQHTVILLCEHQVRGSYGLILNHPIPTEPDDLAQLPLRIKYLFHGGPVQTELMQILHPFGESIPNSVPVAPGIWIGGDYQTLKNGFDNGQLDPVTCRFFLGYAGWSGNQLVQECDNGSWLKTSATEELVFETPPERIWIQAIRTYGNKCPLFANYPEKPDLN
jgi:putative transcriptional regulator